MAKISTFLIVVLLIARGLLYIYDHNKDRIAQLVTPVNNNNIFDTTSNSENAIPYTDTTSIINPTTTVSYTTLTFILSGDKDIYYYVGPFNGTLFTVNKDYVGTFIKAYKNNMTPDNLMFLIKSDKNTTFKAVIDLMDEMSKNEVPQGHYKEADITQEESDKINQIKNTKNG